MYNLQILTSCRMAWDHREALSGVNGSPLSGRRLLWWEDTCGRSKEIS